MNRLLPFLALLLMARTAAADTAEPRANLVILEPLGVENLRLETAVVEPEDFEETVFALGRVAVYPGRRAVVSSRIPGRAVEVRAKHDHPITQGDVAVTVESRQFAEPPPIVQLTAPISGVVSATHVVPGQPVSPDDVLAEIVDLTEVYALAQVPEHLAGRLQRGQIARITAPAVRDQVFEARLEHLGVQAEQESGTIEAAFHVDNPDLALRPGMRAEFAIIVERRTGVMSVPRGALQGDPANRFVYVRDPDLPNGFIKTPVVTGQLNDERVEIVRGLSPADEVVTRGAYSLAFAGAGSLSLKEALDAAHGHAHNPDGSEIEEGTHPDDHHENTEHSSGAKNGRRFWMGVSAVLAVLLVVVSVTKRRPGSAAAPPEAE